jgi:hypothetical protein
MISFQNQCWNWCLRGYGVAVSWCLRAFAERFRNLPRIKADSASSRQIRNPHLQFANITVHLLQRLARKLPTKLKQLLKALAFARNILQCVTRERRQNAHRFENSQDILPSGCASRYPNALEVEEAQPFGLRTGQTISNLEIRILRPIWRRTGQGHG